MQIQPFEIVYPKLILDLNMFGRYMDFLSVTTFDFNGAREQ